MSEAEVLAYKADRRRASMTPAEIEVIREYEREYMRERRASMTPEQRAEESAQRRAKYAAMTPEQKQRRIDKARERRQRAKEDKDT